MPFNKQPSRQGDLRHTSHSLPCPGSVFKTSKWENGGTAEIHAAATVLQKAVISHVVFLKQRCEKMKPCRFLQKVFESKPRSLKPRPSFEMG